MNRGLAVAGFIARRRLMKTAGVGDAAARGAVGLGGLVRKAGKTLTGAGKAWGEGAEAVGRSATRQLRQAGVKGARTKGRMASGALKAAPWLAGGYLGYKAFEPEVRSAKHRLGQALRGRVELFKARRRAALPYYHQGRFQ